jgi:DNA polymerase I
VARKPRPGARTERHLTAPRTLYLIDGDAYIHRAFHALPPLTNSRGEPVGAIYGFARMLQKILRQGNPDYVAVCFDTAAPTFRHKAFDQYKAHRKELDDALKHQLPLAKELARAWGLPVVAMEGYEADDLIATLAHKAARKGVKVVVVTGDKDAMQLVGRNIAVLAEPQGVRYEESDVEKKYGLRPDQMVDFFALTGDASDNVPGVPGIGPKTAAQLLQKYGTLDAALSRTREMKDSLKDKLEAHREDALMSRSLVALDLKAPVAVDPEACVRKAPGEELLELFKRYEFKGLLEEAAAQAPGKRGKVEVTTVLTAAALEKLAKEARSAEALAVNVRTAGPALVGLAIAAKPGAAWYVPVGHGYLGHPAQLSAAAVLKALAPALEDEALPKASQNLKSDILALKRQGVDLRGGEFDVLVASYCLNPARAAFDLNELALDLLGEGMTSLEEVVGKGAKQVTFDQVEIKAAAEYAGAGAEASLRLREKMTPLLREKGVDKLYRDVELPLIGLLAEMERLGVRLDVKYLKDLEGSFAEEIAAVEKAVHGLAGYTFNIGSPKQLAELLFEKLKLPVIRRTKTGFSTDEEVLQKLSALHPLPAKVLEYRELSKLKSTYIDALLALADERGRVHTSLNQAVTATGRLSSTEPNLQNIPIRTEHGRLIRKAFTTEKGWVLVSADYSQIDLRVLAHVSRDPVLCESFRNGEDVHAAAAREIFGLAK